MKTAISVPDEIFGRATRRARALGMNRSELLTAAVRRYLDELDTESLTHDIDAALDIVGDDESVDTAVRAGRQRPAKDDEW